MEMPFSVEAVFGKKGNVPVVAVVDSEEVRTTLMPAGGGRHLMMVNLDLQKKIRKRAGMTVRVSVEFDPVPRLVEMPIDFEDALENNPLAKQFFFDVLPPSRAFNADGPRAAHTRLGSFDRRDHVVLVQVAASTAHQHMSWVPSGPRKKIAGKQIVLGPALRTLSRLHPEEVLGAGSLAALQTSRRVELADRNPRGR